jgi:phosphate:Na+ symporter
MSREIADRRRRHRPRVMAQTATGENDPARALAQLDAMRWVDRIAYHTWRAVEHLGDESAVTLQEGSTAPSDDGGDDHA